MRASLAEFVGTFVLVLGGCGSAVLAADHIGYLGVALAFGLSVVAMAYAIGPISGCHLNPAVTFGLLLSRKIDAATAGRYVVAQILGAIAAAAVLLVIAKGTGHYDPVTAGFATNGYAERSPGGYDVTSAFVAEVFLTALLVLTVLGTTDVAAPVGFAGLAIGLALTLIHLVGIPVTNTSVNPARSIGPALFVGGAAVQQLWLFIIAPLLGAALAAVAFHAMKLPSALAAGAAERVARGSTSAGD
jgi:aquaporin Z